MPDVCPERPLGRPVAQIVVPDTGLAKLTGAEDGKIYAQIAAMHRRQLAAGALAHFPERFLANFYCYTAKRADCAIFVVQDRDRVIGFVAGTTQSSGLLASFAVTSPIEMVRSGLSLLLKPQILGRVTSLLLFITAGTRRSRFGDCQLLSIAVASENERCGFGSALFAALCGWFRSVGATSFEIIAATTQTSALQFYRRHGANEVGHAALGGLEAIILRYTMQ